MPKDSSSKAAKRAYLKKKRRDRNQPVVHREALGLQATPSSGAAPATATAEAPATKSEAVTQPTRSGKRAEATAKAMLLRYSYTGGEVKRILILFGVILVVLVALAVVLPKLS